VASTYRTLNRIGNYEACAGIYNVEEFVVITELAQNKTSGFATSNFQGINFQATYKDRAKRGPTKLD
jgi:hypothetical protein